MNTVANLWNESELKNTPQTAVIGKKSRFTYGELGDRIRSISANLMDKWKVRPGDVVALMAPNSTEFVISYFAVVNIGAVVQPIDERLAPNEIRFVLSDSGARFLIVHHKLWTKYKKAQQELFTPEKILETSCKIPTTAVRPAIAVTMMVGALFFFLRLIVNNA